MINDRKTAERAVYDNGVSLGPADRSAIAEMNLLLKRMHARRCAWFRKSADR